MRVYSALLLLCKGKGNTMENTVLFALSFISVLPKKKKNTEQMHLFAKQKCFLFLINWILMKNWLSNAKLTFEDKSYKPYGAKSCPSYAGSYTIEKSTHQDLDKWSSYTLINSPWDSFICTTRTFMFHFIFFLLLLSAHPSLYFCISSGKVLLPPTPFLNHPILL